MHVSFLFRITSTILIIVGCVLISFQNLSNALKEHCKDVANLQMNKITTVITNHTIMTLLEESYKQESFVMVNLEKIEYDTILINRLLYQSTKSIYQHLKLLEKGDLESLSDKINLEEIKDSSLYYIPISVASGNIFLSALGPKVPIRFKLLGDLKVECLTSVIDYGINNAVISLKMNVSIQSKVIIPLSSDLSINTIEVPFYMENYNGKVPSYYFDSNIQGVNAIYSSEVML